MKGKKVLFSHSYFYPLDPKQWENKTPYPPLATILAASCLRELEYEVSLFDTNLKHNISGLRELLEQGGFDYFVVYDDGFNYLSKMCLTNMRDAAKEMIKLASGLGLKVVVSSSDSTDHYEQYISAGADAVLLGEGEKSLEEVLDLWNADKELNESVSGIAFKQGDAAIKNPRRPVIKNLDELPLPAWDLVDIDAYKAVWAQGKYPFALNIATTRGCPFKCNWCAKPIYGQRYNSRTPEHVVDEIEFLIKTYQVSRFWMCDDIFGLKPGWVQAFNQELKSRNLKIQYKIQSRADLLMADDTIEVLAESGLYEVWIGAESGSQKILDAMDKGTTLEQIKSSTTLLQSKGVRVAYFLQFGYLGETKEDIYKTIDMLKANQPDDIGISVSYPLPETPFYDKVKSELGDKTNWTDSDELAMMFQGTFNTDFYKTLHRYVHKWFRTVQGRKGLVNLFKMKKPDYIQTRSMLALPINWIQSIRFKQKLKRFDKNTAH